jgi:predicted kinase
MKLTELILSESLNDKGIFKAVFFAGTPAAGKTYTLGKITDGAIQPRIVNTDKFYEFLGNITGIDLGETGSADVKAELVDKSTQLTKSQLKLYLNSMLPLFIDGTSSNINNILRRVGILESLGYDVAMIWIDASLETSLSRAKERNRHVSPEFIKRAHELSEENKIFYESKFSNFYSVKNDGELNNEAIEKAYKKVASFFSSSVKNPIGHRNIVKLKELKQKYLTPEIYTLDHLEKSLNSWYRRG